MKKETSSMKQNRFIANTIVHIILSIMAIVWLFPVFWIISESFNAGATSGSDSFLPTGFTLDNYIKLFTDTSQFFFVKWFFEQVAVVAVHHALNGLQFVLVKAFLLQTAEQRLASVGVLPLLAQVLGAVEE